MISRQERILILAKTYPSPSAKHVETSCVAGITESGAMRRLYPVPFRMIEEGSQFKKWQWIDVRVEKAVRDHRPESHKVYVDTITCGACLEPKVTWAARWPWLEKIPAFSSVEAIDHERLSTGLSLALLRPAKVEELIIERARKPDWTEEEREKLEQELVQGDLFSAAEAKRQVRQLRKVPFDFYYRHVCEVDGEPVERRSKIIDWEAGMLYWNCRRQHGDQWETPFRAKLESKLVNQDLMFLMGNQHRFPDQWMIVSLFYPPRRPAEEDPQISMF